MPTAQQPTAMPTALASRLAEFKREQQEGHGGAGGALLRAPPALAALPSRTQAPGAAGTEAPSAAAAAEPDRGATGGYSGDTIQRAQQFLHSNAAEPTAQPATVPTPAPPAPPPARSQQLLRVDLIKDVRGFGVEYTVTADARLVVVSCTANVGQSSPQPGQEIVGLDGQSVAGNPEAMRAALDSIRDAVPDGEKVEWLFGPPQAALGDETVQMAESMAAHLAAGRPVADETRRTVALEAQRESGKSKVELQREWRHNAVWDIESGLWASPFFGAFAALRFFSLTLLSQLLLIVVSVYTTDGLAFPGCTWMPIISRA